MDLARNPLRPLLTTIVNAEPHEAIPGLSAAPLWMEGEAAKVGVLFSGQKLRIQRHPQPANYLAVHFDHKHALGRLQGFAKFFLLYRGRGDRVFRKRDPRDGNLKLD